MLQNTISTLRWGDVNFWANINKKQTFAVARWRALVVCVGGRMSVRQRIPLSMLTRNTMMGLRARYPTRSEEDEERKVPEKWMNREEWAIVREMQLSERGSYWRRSWDLWTQRPGYQAREDESAFQVAMWEFGSETRLWYPHINRCTGCQKSTKNFCLLTLRSTDRKKPKSPCEQIKQKKKKKKKVGVCRKIRKTKISPHTKRLLLNKERKKKKSNLQG